MHEALGAGARPDEADVLVQVEQVSEAMKKLGWGVAVLPTGLDLDATLASVRARNPDCVFNLVESLSGEGRLIHCLPAVLSVAGVPYTGAGSDAMYVTSQKLLAKQLMQLHGIPTLPYFTNLDRLDNDGTWIVKSVWEHASFGMDDGCVVQGSEAARRRIADCERNFGGEWFAEQFVDGSEFNVSVLELDGEPRILPLAEMTFVDYPRGKPRIVGYAAKWDENAPEYRATRRDFPVLSNEESSRLRHIVQQCWTVFGLRGYARVDLRLDSSGNPWVLEINANPCLSQDAGFAAAAFESGMRYEQVVERIVHAALDPSLLAYRRTG